MIFLKMCLMAPNTDLEHNSVKAILQGANAKQSRN